MTQYDSEKLADLIGERHACLVKLHELGRKQSELIAAGEMGALLRLLSAKNQWLAAMQTVEGELAPYQRQAPEQRAWASPEARKQCAAQAEQCRKLLDKVMQMEQENEQQMIQRRDRVATQLQTAHLAGKARGAYQAQQKKPGKGPHFAGAHTPVSGLAPQDHSQLDIHSDA